MGSNEFVLIRGQPVEIPAEVVSADDPIAARITWYAAQLAGAAPAPVSVPDAPADPDEE